MLIIVRSNDNPGLTLTYFTARSNFVKKKFLKQWIFFQTIAACDLKADRCRQLIEFMNIYEYSICKVNVIFDLGPRSFTY